MLPGGTVKETQHKLHGEAPQKLWLASLYVIYCCKLCIITSETAAGIENWCEGYGQMQMQDKPSCDFFLFSGKKERMGMAINPKLPDQVSTCYSASFSTDRTHHELLGGRWKHCYISEHQG